MIMIASAVIAQRKGEMPFTSSAKDANKSLRNAWLALADFKLDEANNYLRAVLDEDPDCGMCYASLIPFDDQQTVENLEKASTMNLSTDEKLFIDGLMARQENKSNDAYFEPLIKKYPSDNYLHLWIIMNNTNHLRAIELGENLIKRNSKLAPAYNLLGYLYMNRNDMERAETYFDKYLALEPDLANPYDSKGDFMMRAGNIEQAIALYEKALALGMTNSAMKAENARLRLKFPKPSEDDLAKIKTIIPATIDAYEKGDVNQLLKEYSEHALKVWGHNTTAVGLPNIRQSWVDIFKNQEYLKFDGSTGTVYGTGPIAITFGTMESIGKSAGSGNEQQRKENVIYFLEKESDGSWKILLDHFYEAHGDNPELSADDRQQIARLINAWDNALISGEASGDKHLENLASLYSQQAIEIFPNKTSNIGLGNIRARWNMFGKGATFETNRLGPLGIEGLGDRAIAWGIATQKLYPEDSKELITHQFPWGMMLTKEKDHSWKILALHWSYGAK